MGNLNFWMSIGAAQKTAGMKEGKVVDRQPFISIILGVLLTLAIMGGLLVGWSAQQ
jgi:hypothetical protein